MDFNKMNFIFDVGNVLVRYNPLQYLEGLFPDKQLAKRVFNTVFRCPEWELMDQGVLTHAEATKIFCVREPELEPAIQKTMRHLYELFTPISDTIELLPVIKEKGHPLYYLSNIHCEIRDYLVGEYRFFTLFDGGVFSCDVHMTKPSPGIYRHLLDEYRLTPGECLFFDDAEENVDAAEKEGIRSVLFADAECVKPFLDKH
jgi:putative hydrolase of the HAD superfamily